MSLVLRLLGRDPDPAASREHVLLSVLAERRSRAGEGADLGALLRRPARRRPSTQVGALALDAFLPKTRAPGAGRRAQHAARLAHVRELARRARRSTSASG